MIRWKGEPWQALANPWWVIALSESMNMNAQLLGAALQPQLTPPQVKTDAADGADSHPGPSPKPVQRLLP